MLRISIMAMAALMCSSVQALNPHTLKNKLAATQVQVKKPTEHVSRKKLCSGGDCHLLSCHSGCGSCGGCQHQFQNTRLATNGNLAQRAGAVRSNVENAAASHDIADSTGCFDNCCFNHDDCCGCGSGCGGSCNNKRGKITSHTSTNGAAVGFIPAEEIDTTSTCTRDSTEVNSLESKETNSKHKSSSFCGSLNTKRYDCEEACRSDCEHVSGKGSTCCTGDKDSNYESFCCKDGCKCDGCGHCGGCCNCGNPHKAVRGEVDKSVRRIIAKTVNKIVNQALCDSLKNAIDIE